MPTFVEKTEKRLRSSATGVPSGAESSKRSKPIPGGSSTWSSGVPSASATSSERAPEKNRATPLPVVVTCPTARSPAASRMSKSLDMKPVTCCITKVSWDRRVEGRGLSAVESMLAR